MPQLATIAINDGKATPQAHSFSPDDAEKGSAVWYNRTASIPSAMEKLKISLVRPTLATAAIQQLIEIELPVTATVNGVEQVVRTSKFKGTYYFSQSGTQQERDDLFTLVANLHANANVRLVAETLEPFYG